MTHYVVMMAGVVKAVYPTRRAAEKKRAKLMADTKWDLLGVIPWVQEVEND